MPSKVISVNPLDGLPQSSFKRNPLHQVRVLYVSYVRGLFAQAQPGQYHWCDGEESEIFISDEAPVDASSVGQRPAISFTRSAVQFSSLGHDDFLKYDFETGRKTKSVLVPGVMSINCCSSNDLESEYIAWIVAEHLWLLREQLMKLGFFEIGRQITVSSPSPAGSLVANDAGQEWYCTSVASPFQFPRTSQFTPLNKEVIQNIEIQLRAGHSKAISVGVPASPNGDLPFNAHSCRPGSFHPGASDIHGRSPDPAGVHPAPPPTAPHPLNPAVRVFIRSVNPYKASVRPLSIGGRAIPIADPCVKQSSESKPISVKV